MVRGVASDLGLCHVFSVPHQLRHGGPSHDALEQLRSLGQIQQRGRWRARESVRIYEKHGSLLRQRAAVPAA
eukprot:55235-Pyramimonas_sp.AAC.1